MVAMGAEPPVEGGSLPAWLLELVTRTRVVVFCSELTDTRQLEQRLRGAGVEYGIQRLGMGSDAMRRRFGELRAFTRWSTLPQVFLDGRFVGGEPELAAGLQDPSAQ
ncbi:MAG: glutaredoxin, partial [Gammaproteobacteria bacterium]